MPDVDAARAFIAAEPYTANGVFARVEALPWVRVLPEAKPGALDEALASEAPRRRAGHDRAITAESIEVPVPPAAEIVVEFVCHAGTAPADLAAALAQA